MGRRFNDLFYALPDEIKEAAEHYKIPEHMNFLGLANKKEKDDESKNYEEMFRKMQEENPIRQ